MIPPLMLIQNVFVKNISKYGSKDATDDVSEDRYTFDSEEINFEASQEDDNDKEEKIQDVRKDVSRDFFDEISKHGNFDNSEYENEEFNKYINEIKVSLVRMMILKVNMFVMMSNEEVIMETDKVVSIYVHNSVSKYVNNNEDFIEEFEEILREDLNDDAN